jgi:hypothetical protein
VSAVLGATEHIDTAGVGLAAGAVAVAGVLAAALFKRAGRR